MSEPTTAAGRAFADRWRLGAAHGAMQGHVAAIEAEAAAAARAALLEDSIKWADKAAGFGPQYEAVPGDPRGQGSTLIRARRGGDVSATDLDALAAAAHDAWYAEKLDRLVRLGRNSWPNETGEEQLVPWEQLSESVREFDRIVVTAVLAEINRRRPLEPLSMDGCGAGGMRRRRAIDSE